MWQERACDPEHRGAHDTVPTTVAPRRLANRREVVVRGGKTPKSLKIRIAYADAVWKNRKHNMSSYYAKSDRRAFVAEVPAHYGLMV